MDGEIWTSTTSLSDGKAFSCEGVNDLFKAIKRSYFKGNCVSQYSSTSDREERKEKQATSIFSWIYLREDEDMRILVISGHKFFKQCSLVKLFAPGNKTAQVVKWKEKPHCLTSASQREWETKRIGWGGVWHRLGLIHSSWPHASATIICDNDGIPAGPLCVEWFGIDLVH